MPLTKDVNPEEVEIGLTIPPGEERNGIKNPLYSSERCIKCGGKILRGKSVVIRGDTIRANAEKVVFTQIKAVDLEDRSGSICNRCWGEQN